MIAYEIHDGLAQKLSAAIMQFQAFNQLQSQDREQAATTAEAGLQLLRESLSEARRLINGLRPLTLDESGIVAAIEHLVREVKDQADLEIEFHSNVARERLEPLLENAVFRIVQESLANARRHSGSDKLRIEVVKQVNVVRVEIRDWGIGFDPDNVKEDSFGLEGMRERARLLGGHAVVDSAPGKGTRIVVTLPLTVEE
ncbi:MAG: sensor histidine kinase [Planctomycetes bacterium]|nr:sensor histidine kinase [Planctomycetota bacterium]